jgi:hypothetical protein
MANLGRWTKEQESEIIQLANADGATASKIAAAMKTRKVSRTSVISKLANLHIRLSHKTVYQKQVAEQRELVKRVGFLRYIPNQPLVPREATSSDGVTFAELTATSCRWPKGDNPVKYCGAYRNRGSAYCPTHAKAAAGTGTSSERSAIRVAGRFTRTR